GIGSTRGGEHSRTAQLCPSCSGIGGNLPESQLRTSRRGLRLYVFGSSLTSAYWNGAATYYRGLYKNLHALGYQITFAEPDIYDRRQHRDLHADPPYAHCPLYRNRKELNEHLRQAREADLIIKHSGVGSEDEYLEGA